MSSNSLASFLATLAILAVLMEVAARVYQDYAHRLLEAIPALIGA